MIGTLLMAAAVLVQTRPAPSTPGEIIPNITAKDVCAPDYAKKARKVSLALKKQVCAAYGKDPKGCPGPAWEIDHEISLELGGANTVKNLWPQPILEAKVKDKDENRLHHAVCSGKMSLADAQKEILAKWGPNTK